MTAISINLEQVADGYIQCALWADATPACDHDPSECGCESGGLEGSPVSDQDRLKIRELIARWIFDNGDDVALYLASIDGTCPPDSFGRTEYSPEECLGHDLRYTAGGHGTGFWDRGMGELGERLTVAAKSFGEIECWEERADFAPGGRAVRFDV